MSGENLENGLVRIFDISTLHPSPDNDLIYRPASANDPGIKDLAASIRKHGVMEPLVITLDNIILSGHRRRVACMVAGVRQVPCRIEPIFSYDDEFIPKLREYNRQREKTLDEKLREEIVSADPHDSYESLVEYRKQQSMIDLEGIQIEAPKKRAQISRAKEPFLAAIKDVIKQLRKYWPISVRQIHYRLLNNPPLRHASKPDSTYCNDLDSYKSLDELVTRARLTGQIPFRVIADETRPVTTWDVFGDPAPFVRQQLDEFLKGYWRNLQQSQPNHIEIVGEKNTVGGILRPIAGKYCIPLTIGRGFSSIPPRYEMAQRFFKSGKSKLILLIVSDFDPDGEQICNSFARSMRDDFGVSRIEAVKVALTQDQVQSYQLPPDLEAKQGSPNYQRFVDKYGTAVSELEALEPDALQRELSNAIDAVMDCDLFNAEVESEAQDAAFLEAARVQIHRAAMQITQGGQE